MFSTGYTPPAVQAKAFFLEFSEIPTDLIGFYQEFCCAPSREGGVFGCEGEFEVANHLAPHGAALFWFGQNYIYPGPSISDRYQDAVQPHSGVRPE